MWDAGFSNTSLLSHANSGYYASPQNQPRLGLSDFAANEQNHYFGQSVQPASLQPVEAAVSSTVLERLPVQQIHAPAKYDAAVTLQCPSRYLKGQGGS